MQQEYNDIIYEVNEIYSYQNYTGHDLSNNNDMSGIIIYGSCFSQERPDSIILPQSISGSTFVNCNLDNVYIPDNNVVIGGSQRRFKAQDDGLDWEVDANDLPIKILGT